MPNLDRKRAFGVVYGHPNIGFMQDEKPFKPDGSPYIEPVDPTKPIPPVAAPKVEELPTAEQLAEKPLTQSEKMKQVWAARRAAEHAHQT
jgi:hypothetical protein